MDTKRSLTQELATVVKRALKDSEAGSSQPVSVDVLSTVCNTVEAIFIHGLRDAYFVRGTRGTKYPEPNFWLFVGHFAHRNVLTQIRKLSQIKTDVGRARAWVRITLNEGVMEHYISALARDRTTVKLVVFDYGHCYEQVDILIAYMKGLDKLVFNAPINSSILNAWTPTPLKLAGLLTDAGNLCAQPHTGGGMLQMEDIAERDDDQAVSALEYEGLDDDDGRLLASRAVLASGARMHNQSRSYVATTLSDDDGASTVSHMSLMDSRLGEAVRSAMHFATRVNDVRSGTPSAHTSTSGDVLDENAHVEDVEESGTVMELSEQLDDANTRARAQDAVEGRAVSGAHISTTVVQVVVKRNKRSSRIALPSHVRQTGTRIAHSPRRDIFAPSSLSNVAVPPTIVETEPAPDCSAAPAKEHDSGTESTSDKSTASPIEPGTVDAKHDSLFDNLTNDEQTSATTTTVDLILSREAVISDCEHVQAVNADTVSCVQMCFVETISSSPVGDTTDTTADGLPLLDTTDVLLHDTTTASGDESSISTPGGGNSLCGREWSARNRTESMAFYERLEQQAEPQASFGSAIRSVLLAQQHTQQLRLMDNFETQSSDAPTDAGDADGSQQFNETINEKCTEIGVAVINDTLSAASTSRLQHSPSEDVENRDGFVHVTSEQVSSATSEWDTLNSARLALLTRLAPERGLRAQHFRCPTCRRMLGPGFDAYRLCVFDGFYYCYECHRDDTMVIPARVLLNCDTRPMKVCRATRAFIAHVADRPLLRVDQCNPSLYEHSPVMMNIYILRQKLSLVAVYLLTCKESVADDLRKRMWPKEYLYDDIHLYSDLLAPATLAAHVQSVLTYACAHVYECRLCACKGYICELCNHAQVVYPFEMDTTYRCPKCYSVFHQACMRTRVNSGNDSASTCPKCARREAYERQKKAQHSAAHNTPSLLGFDDTADE